MTWNLGVIAAALVAGDRSPRESGGTGGTRRRLPARRRAVKESPNPANPAGGPGRTSAFAERWHRGESRYRYAEAIRHIEPVRDIACRFGGSHAQRDAVTLTLIEAAIRSGQSALARHDIAERTVHKPASGWGWRLLARATSRPEEEPGPPVASEKSGVNPESVGEHGASDHPCASPSGGETHAGH